MIEVTSEVEVARAADEVFRYLADASNNPEWQRGMRSCRWVTDGPIGVGSRYHQEATFLGRPVRSVFEVTAFDDERSITIRTIESTFPIEVTRAVEPIGQGRCRVQAHVRGGPQGFAARFDPLTRRLVERSVRRDYQQLTSRLEAG